MCLLCVWQVQESVFKACRTAVLVCVWVCVCVSVCAGYFTLWPLDMCSIYSECSGVSWKLSPVALNCTFIFRHIVTLCFTNLLFHHSVFSVHVKLDSHYFICIHTTVKFEFQLSRLSLFTHPHVAPNNNFIFILQKTWNITHESYEPLALLFWKLTAPHVIHIHSERSDQDHFKNNNTLKVERFDHHGNAFWLSVMLKA